MQNKSVFRAVFLACSILENVTHVTLILTYVFIKIKLIIKSKRWALRAFCKKEPSALAKAIGRLCSIWPRQPAEWEQRAVSSLPGADRTAASAI